MIFEQAKLSKQNTLQKSKHLRTFCKHFHKTGSSTNDSFSVLPWLISKSICCSKFRIPHSSASPADNLTLTCLPCWAPHCRACLQQKTQETFQVWVRWPRFLAVILFMCLERIGLIFRRPQFVTLISEWINKNLNFHRMGRSCWRRSHRRLLSPWDHLRLPASAKCYPPSAYTRNQSVSCDRLFNRPVIKHRSS